MSAKLRSIALGVAAALLAGSSSSASAEDVPAITASTGFRAIAARNIARLRIAIEYPEPGQQVVAPDGKGFITGTAFQMRGRGVGEFDVYVVIDTSDSTRRPAGADIDGNGRVGVQRPLRRIPLLGDLFDPESTDPGDSVLACEVKAAKTLLSQLDPETTRVGVIGFSGTPIPDRQKTADARIVAPLTRQYDMLVTRLDELLAAGPGGETNLIAAVQTATLAFERDYLTNPRRRVQRLALLISDGKATLPVTLPLRERSSGAVEAAQDAKQFSARIDTYAVGKEDAASLETLEQIAAATGGSFVRVDQPANLVANFQALDLAQIADLQVRNVTMNQPTKDVSIDPYGTFSALVPLQEGENSLEVFARSNAGIEQRERISVFYRRAEGYSAIPVRALARRAKLLEERLRQAYADDMARVRAERARRRSIEVKAE